VNMQDDFSSVHRVAKQKRYDPNAGTRAGMHCNMHACFTAMQLLM